MLNILQDIFVGASEPGSSVLVLMSRAGNLILDLLLWNPGSWSCRFCCSVLVQPGNPLPRFSSLHIQEGVEVTQRPIDRDGSALTSLLYSMVVAKMLLFFLWSRSVILAIESWCLKQGSFLNKIISQMLGYRLCSFQTTRKLRQENSWVQRDPNN